MAGYLDFGYPCLKFLQDFVQVIDVEIGYVGLFSQSRDQILMVKPFPKTTYDAYNESIPYTIQHT